MQLVIVGHGPSLLERRRGDEIDGYDEVCRLKIGHKLLKNLPEDYGTRMDYLCSTLKTWGGYWTLKIKEYWGYQNFPGQDKKLPKIYHHFGKTPVRTEHKAILYWLGIYRSMADIHVPSDTTWVRPEEGDEPWFSTGMGAIVIASAGLKPESISLIGFDNMENGRRDNFKSVIREKKFTNYPRHAWNVERDMVPLIAKHYGVEIEFV